MSKRPLKKKQAQKTLVWYRRDWFRGFALILLVILAYIPVWNAGFIWDDDTILTGNPCVVGPLGLKEIWTTNAADICPLTITTFWLEHAIWGLAPLPYHIVNVLLHAGSAVVLWRVLRRLKVPGSWLGAALWVLHPVQVESVAWITEMKNTESALFFLLSILYFLKSIPSSNDASTHSPVTSPLPVSERANGRIALVCAFLAMASKSSTVILPVVLILCAWWIQGRWNWRTILRTIPLFILSAATSAVSIWTQGFQLAAVNDPQWNRSWPQRIAAAGDAVWFYVGKLFWPNPLIEIYPRWNIHAGHWASYLALLGVVAAFILLWCHRRPWSRACLFAFSYFVIALLPALGLVDNYVFRYALVFDHFQYLASIGPLALAGAALASILRLRAPITTQFSIGDPPVRDYAPSNATLGFAVSGGFLLLLGILTWQRAAVFQNHETLWTDTLAKNPACWVGHSNLGLAMLQNGDTDAALAHFQKAIALNPKYVEALCNLGIVLCQSNRSEEGIAQYRRALQIDPRYPVAHYDLGNELGQKGEVDQAIEEYRKAIESNPEYAEAHNNLGNLLLRKGDQSKAMQQYQLAVKAKPDYAVAHGNVGLMLFQAGQLQEAIQEFRRALQLDPTLTPVRDALSEAETALRNAN